MKKLIEIRTYTLQPGTGPAFHALVDQQSVPLLRAAGMDVVGYGISRHDPDAYFLIRAFDSLEHLHSAQDSFYASPAWRQGPREAIISLILTDANAVMSLPLSAIEALRAGLLATPA